MTACTTKQKNSYEHRFENIYQGDSLWAEFSTRIDKTNVLPALIVLFSNGHSFLVSLGGIDADGASLPPKSNLERFDTVVK
jgi:hypothetical protein